MPLEKLTWQLPLSSTGTTPPLGWVFFPSDTAAPQPRGTGSGRPPLSRSRGNLIKTESDDTHAPTTRDIIWVKGKKSSLRGDPNIAKAEHLDPQLEGYASTILRC